MKQKIEPEFIARIRERIKKRMKALGLSQAELADRAGVSRSGITELMKRDRSPSSEFLMKIASELSVSVDYLLGRTEEPEINDLIQHERVRTMLEVFLNLSVADQDRAIQMVKLMRGTQNPSSEEIT